MMFDNVILDDQYADISSQVINVEKLKRRLKLAKDANSKRYKKKGKM